MTVRIASGRLFWLLVSAAAVGQGSLHIVLPALGIIAHGYGVPFGQAQLTLSLAMVSMAASTLVTGPLSDIFGRRPVFLGGVAMLAAGSVAGAVAGSIETLIAARMVQCAGGVTGVVLGRAIMRDLYDEATATKGISYLIFGQIAGPAIAPVLGALLLLAGPWTLLFWVSAACALVLLGFAIPLIPETRDPERAHPGRFLVQARILLATPRFWAAACVGGFTMALFFSLVSGGSWAVSERYALSEIWYAVLMTVFVVHFTAGNLLCGRVVGRFGPDRLIRFGIAGTTVALALLAFQIHVDSHPAWMLTGCGLFALANGFVIPSSIAIGINTRPQAAGTASGVIVAVQLSLSAAITQPLGAALDAIGMASLFYVFALVLAGVWACVAVLHRTQPGRA